MRRLTKGLIAAALLAAAGITVTGSSHREALAILNEPCADNTDTYAWVSNGLHDKLYLIMDFYPLHEPGQCQGRFVAVSSPRAAADRILDPERSVPAIATARPFRIGHWKSSPLRNPMPMVRS